MADVRPLPGIRYAAQADLAALVCPPYDVISPEAQARYYERSPYNAIRLELGREEPGDDELDNRYTRAAMTYAEWRLGNVLRQDTPAFYLSEQRFSASGQSYTRQTLFARVRLERWDAGVILPHERTLSKPKDDRLKLTRACATNLSPIMALYDDPDGELAMALDSVRSSAPAATFTDDDGVENRLWVVEDDALATRVSTFFARRQLYIADGHHRYETALNYRDEVREAHKELLIDDAANFTLMGLSALEDPGLVVLPTHRIVRDVDQARIDALLPALEPSFEVTPLDGDVDAWVQSLAGTDETTPAFVLIAPETAYRLRLRPAGAAAMSSRAGEDRGASDAWRALDVAVLHELVLRDGLGITGEAIRAGEYITYTRDPAQAASAVASGTGGARLALLLRSTPPAAIRDVARAGDRMPQKSTYFYPKLLTGLVLNPLW